MKKKTIIRPVILYALETWLPRGKQKKINSRFRKDLEREILWKMFGLTKYNVTGEWDLRKNRDLEAIHNEKTILKTYKNEVYDGQVKTRYLDSVETNLDKLSR